MSKHKEQMPSPLIIFLSIVVYIFYLIVEFIPAGLGKRYIKKQK